MGVASTTIIVGAGPAGLAVAGQLRQRGHEFTLLEAGPQIAQSWRHHYDRLHLHTPTQTSELRGFAFPRGTPTFASRDQVVDYLDAYASHFGIEPRLNERMTRAERIDGQWSVTTTHGTISADNLVITTGLLRIPYRPELPGERDFGGSISHAGTYANARPFLGKRVLVVGFGNSGAEIACDLGESNVSVGVVVRSPYNIIPRKLMEKPPGVPRSVFIWMAQTVPAAWLDAGMRLGARIVLGNLRAHGLRSPSYGVVSGLKRGKVPLIDVGTIGAIKSGRITVYPSITRLTKTGAVFDDGRAADFDCVLMATGYRTGLQEIIRDSHLVLDEAGVPKTIGRESELPNLYFVGFEVRVLGQLFTTMIDARAVVDRLTS